MSHRLPEPYVVGVNVKPDTVSRECCGNCGAKPRCERAYYDWFWCSDYITETEVLLRAEALEDAGGKPLMSLGEYLEARREVAESG